MIGLLLLLVLAAMAGVAVALNTATGRQFAEQKINALGRAKRADCRAGRAFSGGYQAWIASVSPMRRAFGWMRTGLELRWLPQRLLQRDVVVTALSAATLDVARAPVAGAASSKSFQHFPAEFSCRDRAYRRGVAASWRGVGGGECDVARDRGGAGGECDAGECRAGCGDIGWPCDLSAQCRACGENRSAAAACGGTAKRVDRAFRRAGGAGAAIAGCQRWTGRAGQRH